MNHFDEQSRLEIERLTAERDAAFTLSRCQCGTDEACSNLAALRREIAALQAKHDDDKSDLLAMQRERDVCGSGAGCLYKDAQIDALREDAERYRWLRDKACRVDWAEDVSRHLYRAHCRVSPQGMDYDIDAARRGTT